LARLRAAFFAASVASEAWDAALLALSVLKSGTVDLLLMISTQTLPVVGELNPIGEMGLPNRPELRPEPSLTIGWNGLASFAYAIGPATRYCLYRGSASRAKPARGKCGDQET
jgi:hypothetical protein